MQYSTSQRFGTYFLLIMIGLFLQSCSEFPQPTTRVTSTDESEGKKEMYTGGLSEISESEISEIDLARYNVIQGQLGFHLDKVRPFSEYCVNNKIYNILLITNLNYWTLEEGDLFMLKNEFDTHAFCMEWSRKKSCLGSSSNKKLGKMFENILNDKTKIYKSKKVVNRSYTAYCFNDHLILLDNKGFIFMVYKIFHSA